MAHNPSQACTYEPTTSDFDPSRKPNPTLHPKPYHLRPNPISNTNQVVRSYEPTFVPDTTSPVGGGGITGDGGFTGEDIGITVALSVSRLTLEFGLRLSLTLTQTLTLTLALTLT